MAHFYKDGEAILKRYPEVCQCPLGLMTHFYLAASPDGPKFQLLVSMPSRADDSFLHRAYQCSLELSSGVSMPSRADDSFLRYPFKNLGFMRFPEPIFTGICQNILTKPPFHACLQFGHI